MFDVFAIGTYFTSSVIFLFFGMIPDFAVLKHNTTGWRKQLYTILSFNWKGTDKQWFIHGRATMLFASFIMPLVVSVHSIVSWDFALSVVPGYSKSIFAPYFVTGALLSGFAGVTIMLTVLRAGYPPFKKYITEHHYDSMGKVILLLSLVWTYLTLMEVLTGVYANVSVENESLRYKILTAPHGQLFFFMIFCNSILPLIYIFKRVRIKPAVVMIACIFIMTGMWLERFLIVPNALSRKFLPWMWHEYVPSWVEISISVGAVMFFITMFMVSIKIFPVLSFFEVKEDQGVPTKKKGH
jgi:molybdopterin-containing oxidoreductase family membrane subunit